MDKKKRFMAVIFPMIFDSKIQDHWELFLTQALQTPDYSINKDIMAGIKKFKEEFLQRQSRAIIVKCPPITFT